MIIRGRAWKFGDDVDTDAIIPARYLNTSDPAGWPGTAWRTPILIFRKEVKPGEIIVAGKNFGCGSSGTCPLAIKAAGVGAVGHLLRPHFYRNAFNIGLPILITPKRRRE